LPFSYVGKVENLGETLQRFQQHLYLSGPLPRKRSNASNYGAIKFTETLANKIHSLYLDDFETFGYDKNAWPSEQQNADELGSMVPEEKFNDEIIERNLIIYYLYQERDRLQAKLQKNPSVLLRRLWDRCRRKSP
jgi:hypothetical protein